MEELTSIVELSESVLDMVLDVMRSYLPLATLPFAVYLAICLIRLVLLSADMAGSDPVYREKLTEADIKTINQELRTLETMGQAKAKPKPESTHRGEAASEPVQVHRANAKPTLTERMLADVPEPAVKMVPCKYCLAPKPEHGTCAYCGLG